MPVNVVSTDAVVSLNTVTTCQFAVFPFQKRCLPWTLPWGNTLSVFSTSLHPNGSVSFIITWTYSIFCLCRVTFRTHSSYESSYVCLRPVRNACIVRWYDMERRPRAGTTPSTSSTSADSFRYSKGSEPVKSAQSSLCMTRKSKQIGDQVGIVLFAKIIFKCDVSSLLTYVIYVSFETSILYGLPSLLQYHRKYKFVFHKFSWKKNITRNHCHNVGAVLQSGTHKRISFSSELWAGLNT